MDLYLLMPHYLLNLLLQDIDLLVILLSYLVQLRYVLILLLLYLVPDQAIKRLPHFFIVQHLLLALILNDFQLVLQLFVFLLIVVLVQFLAYL